MNVDHVYSVILTAILRNKSSLNSQHSQSWPGLVPVLGLVPPGCAAAFLGIFLGRPETPSSISPRSPGLSLSLLSLYLSAVFSFSFHPLTKYSRNQHKQYILPLLESTLTVGPLLFVRPCRGHFYALSCCLSSLIIPFSSPVSFSWLSLLPLCLLIPLLPRKRQENTPGLGNVGAPRHHSRCARCHARAACPGAPAPAASSTSSNHSVSCDCCPDINATRGACDNLAVGLGRGDGCCGHRCREPEPCLGHGSCGRGTRVFMAGLC